jgi:hypothetical protein
MILMAVVGASGGDFTWRMQAIISHVKVALPAAWVLATAVVTLGLRREPSSRLRVRWIVSLSLLLLGFAADCYIQVVLDSTILSWNPNWPPADWEAVRDRWVAWNWCRVGASSLAFGFTLSCLASRTSDEPKPA